MKTQLHYLFITLTLLAIGNVARSANITWTNATGGNWNTAANWNPNQVPGGGDSASIPAGGINVLIGAANSAGGLSLGAGSSLTVGRNGVLNIEGNAGNVALYGVLTNQGTVNWQGGYVLVYYISSIGWTGEIWNLTNAVWNIQCDRDMTVPEDLPTFHNGGSLIKSAGSGTTYINDYLDNSGTVEAQNGTIICGGGGSCGGRLIADSGAALDLASGTFTVVPGLAVSGAGAVVVTGGTLNLTQVTNFISNLQLSAGVSVVTGPSFQGTITNTVTVGSLTLYGPLVLTNMLTVGNLTLYGSLVVGNGAILNVGGGSIAVGSSLTVGSNGMMNIGGTVDLYGVLTNQGTVNWQGGYVVVYYYPPTGWTGEIWNLTNGVWNIQCDQDMTVGEDSTHIPQRGKFD